MFSSPTRLPEPVHKDYACHHNICCCSRHLGEIFDISQAIPEPKRRGQRACVLELTHYDENSNTPTGDADVGECAGERRANAGVCGRPITVMIKWPFPLRPWVSSV